MTDTTDDMEADAARLFCRKCKKHFEDCECGEFDRWIKMIDKLKAIKEL